MKQRILYLVCGIPAGIILFLILTVWFTPNEALRGVVERSAENAGYTLSFAGFGKAFPAGVKAAGVEVSTAKGPVLKLVNARAGLRILPLFVGKVRVAYRAKIGGGDVEGQVGIGKDGSWRIDGRGVRLEDVPFFTTVAGARMKGELRVKGEATMRKGVPSGDLQLEVRGAELAGVKIGEMPLPDATYRQVRGALAIDKGQAQIKSFTLDGEGIYVRLKGNTTLMKPMANSPLDLTVEMMPKPDFLERQKFIFLVLTKYQTSPGAYSIPVRGTLGHPAL